MRHEFERCKPWLEDALQYSGGEMTIEDVWQAIEAGELTFWPGKRCAIVLQFVTHPRKRVMNWYLAGGDLNELRDMEQTGTEWAKSNGFDAVVIYGRRGWLRKLDGYQETGTIMEKNLWAV